MTAEIAILNKHGIVLAADSAVTVSFGHGQVKTYNAVNKLFSLGGSHDIGIMIYGNAEFMSIPWEIIIKEFRKRNKDIVFDRLELCSSAFLEFLKDEKFRNETISKQAIQSVIDSLLEHLLEMSSERVNYIQKQNPEKAISLDDITQIISGVITETAKTYSNNEDMLLNGLSKEKFSLLFSEYCKNKLRENIYIEERIHMLDDIFIALAYQMVVFNSLFDTCSGVVVGGYGSEELFPSLAAFEISYIFENEIKLKKTHTSIVDLLNSDASIVPFAQTDMISTILTGIDPIMSEVIIKSINKLGNSSNSDKKLVIDEISSCQQQKFINPILGVVRTLALPELANMAETLVNLTLFKRHITDSLETVGGPVDVLVISKGDGPIWINRKEYFDISKNLEYRNRKSR